MPATPANPLGVDARALDGPFDIIGDVHACADELEDLLRQLGYARSADDAWASRLGRLAVFVGDFVDRGPANVRTLDMVMRMVQAGSALAVPGNHDLQLWRHLRHGDAPLVHGLEDTVAELAETPDAFREAVADFFERLPGHLVLAGGALVVAHTGLPASLHGVDSADTRRLAAYGVLDGEMDPHDPDKRHPWVHDHHGPPVIYGHTPVLEPRWRNHSIDIDTGCVFGWRLTALRWPERDIVFVPARAQYAHRSRPFLPSELAASS